MKFFYIAQLVLVMLVGVTDALADPVDKQIAELVETADKTGVIQGKDGWLFLKEELEHLSSTSFYGEEVLKVTKATKPQFGDPLPAIVDFNKQLKERNIELIFVPIPPKALIYIDKLPGDFVLEMASELEQPYEELYAQLKSRDVKVLDLIPVFKKERKKEQMYCKTDSHFSGKGLSVVAREVSQVLHGQDWYQGTSKKEYTKTEREVLIHGDLAVMQNTDIKESISLVFVNDLSTGKAEIPDPNSPVLLLGDSHTLVFSVGGDLHANGAGLFDQLNADIGFPVDLLGVRGSGATPSRIKLYQRSRKDSAYLQKKKVIIWCMSSRELTGRGGWRKIPVAKKK